MSGAYSPGRTAGSSGSCSGGCFDERQVKIQYLSGYFTAHMLPASSYRYVYLLWFVTIVVCLVLGTAHILGVGERTRIGAIWKRWATKNRVYKVGKRTDIYGNVLSKADSAPATDVNAYPPTSSSRLAPRPQHGPPKRRRVFTFPSFGRMILLFFMIAVPIVLTLVGADFIGPNYGIFDFSQSWPSQVSPQTVGLSRRLLQRRVQWGIGDYPSVTTYPPTRTLPYRTWWTSGDRTGDMTSGLVSIVVVMALKQVPFALLSTRIFGGYAFDRLSFLHKWGGRIIWLFGTAHLVTWTIQLNKDQRLGDPVWSFVFLWTKFRWGWASYGFLTAMTMLSIGPIRNRFYEFFYVAHIVTVVGFIVCGILHHPPLAQWLYIPLAWWGADRIARLVKVAWVNGVGFAGRKPQFAVAPKAHSMSTHNSQEKHLSGFGTYAESSRGHGTLPASISSHKPSLPPSSYSSEYDHPLMGDGRNVTFEARGDPYAEHYGATPEHVRLEQAGSPYGRGARIDRRTTKLSARYDPVSDLILDYARQDSEHEAQDAHDEPVKYALEDPGAAGPTPGEMWADGRQPPRTAGQPRPQSAGRQHSEMSSRMSVFQARQSGPSFKPRPAMSADVAAVIRPGYAFVQLLPGKTLRLTLRTPNKMSWKPGQWVYLNIPGVRWFESHPFTIASAHDAEFPVSTKFADIDEEKGLVGRADKAKGEERTMVLLVRARRGFTLHLWDHVVKCRQMQIEAVSDAQPGSQLGGFLEQQAVIGKGTTGVHVRAIVDGPYGSAKRTNWGAHSSIVIVCGGSGVSFGMAALEHLCACIVGADRLGRSGKGGRGFITQRIRFVWIMREFAHLQWVASALRRCIEMLPPDQLQVDLYVTHYNDMSTVKSQATLYNPGSEFAPPSAPFGSHSGRDSFISVNHTPGSSAPSAARFTEGPEQEEFDLTAYDLTHFDGEDQSAPTAAEMEMSKRIRSEGKLRRAHTRKATMKKKGRRGKSSEPVASPARPPLQVFGQDLGEQTVSVDSPAHSRDNSLGIHMGQPARPRFGTTGSNLSLPPPPTPGFILPDPSMPGTPCFDPLVLGPDTPPEFENQSPPHSRYSSVHLVQPTEEVPIDLDDEEDIDLRVVAELARPGHPKLDRIIREEVNNSHGRVLVASCGPISLGAVLRSIVSKQINLDRVKQGDLRGHVNIVNESFEWGG